MPKNRPNKHPHIFHSLLLRWKDLKHDPKTQEQRWHDIQLAIKENAGFLQNYNARSKPIPLRCTAFDITVLKFNICRCWFASKPFLPCFKCSREGGRLSILTQVYNAAARACLFWRGQSSSSKPTPSQPSPLCLERQRIIDSVCVCVCLLNVWLAGSGVGVVRTLEATTWGTTSDPAHLPRYTLTPALRSDSAGTCRKWLIVGNVRAGFEGKLD